MGDVDEDIERIWNGCSRAGYRHHRHHQAKQPAPQAAPARRLTVLKRIYPSLSLIMFVHA